MTAAVHITWHARQRWQERVDATAGRARAEEELRAFVAAGRVRPRPRHWTTITARPGLVFVYNADQPDIVVLVQDRAAITVLTRAVCRGRRVYGNEAGRATRPRPSPPPIPLSWEPYEAPEPSRANPQDERQMQPAMTSQYEGWGDAVATPHPAEPPPVRLAPAVRFQRNASGDSAVRSETIAMHEPRN